MTPANRRILVIDDNRAIHEDFRKILNLGCGVNRKLSAFEDELFGATTPEENPDGFEISSAFQGQEALEMVRRAEADGRPFAMAFVDVRMPPGWDGVETLSRIWEVAPSLQAVICTAYSDLSNDEIIERLGGVDRLLIIRKPFDPAEVQRVASEFTGKWSGHPEDAAPV